MSRTERPPPRPQVRLRAPGLPWHSRELGGSPWLLSCVPQPLGGKSRPGTARGSGKWKKDFRAKGSGSGRRWSWSPREPLCAQEEPWPRRQGGAAARGSAGSPKEAGPEQGMIHRAWGRR
ncbi:hypothetical protein NDU88_001689 [Pleurodeles waltl]|uniref:Uncharacterized protein n=1 Tax=Pleurodeles waltl TaxID=8319 RepID=A0AAV7VCG2_PLEWA|nr:hypothetical protein NDU88_001689 [Pleurodeles waltl]